MPTSPVSAGRGGEVPELPSADGDHGIRVV